MRRKADGTAFEKEFRESLEDRFYVKRLPTLNTGFSGMSQPADFIVVGDHFNYAEVKETCGDSFSITAMQQFDQMKEFVETRSRLCICRAMRESRYWVIVHFLEHRVLKAVEGQQALEMSKAHKTIRANDATLLTFSSLTELKERMIL